MKKIIITISSFLIALSLVGCQKKEIQNDQIPDKVSDQLASANKKMETFHPNEPLPKDIINTTNKKYLAVLNQGSEANYQVNYGFSNTKTQFGRNPKSDFITAAKLTKKTYGNADLAVEDLKYVDTTKYDTKPNFDLKTGQIGYTMRDSINLYVSWNTNNYYMLVKANSTKNESPEKIAVEVAKQVKNTSLPQAAKGSLYAQVSADENTFPYTLRWIPMNNKNVMYTLSTIDQKTLFTMIKSL